MMNVSGYNKYEPYFYTTMLCIYKFIWYHGEHYSFSITITRLLPAIIFKRWFTQSAYQSTANYLYYLLLYFSMPQMSHFMWNESQKAQLLKAFPQKNLEIGELYIGLSWRLFDAFISVTMELSEN